MSRAPLSKRIDRKLFLLIACGFATFFASIAEAEDGIVRSVEIQIDDSAATIGIGCVLNRTMIDFSTDDAAKKYSDNQSYDDQVKSAFFCGGVGLAISKNPLVGFVAGLSCSSMTVDTRPELRKGDRIVERTHACAAGGVGGTIVHDVRSAFGKRDGKKVVLYTLSVATDASQVKILVEEDFKRY